MKAVVLAAGKGTRMKNLTADIPKPMVPVGNKPMLEHIIGALTAADITEVVLVVGYKKEVVINHFGDGTGFGCSIRYREQTEQKGTGDALACARNSGIDSPFFFTFGDVMTTPDTYRGMRRMYEKSDADVVLGLNVVDDPWRGAAVYLDKDNTVTRMVEKPPKGTSTTRLNNAGIMILPPDIFSYTNRLALSPRGEYELTDVFSMLVSDGRKLKGYTLSGYWRDVGTPEDLRRMNEMFEKGI